MEPTVTHLVHGTWGRGQLLHLRESVAAMFPWAAPWLRPAKLSPVWVDEESPLGRQLTTANFQLSRFDWSGSNSFAARRTAAVAFAKYFRDSIERKPDARHVIIAHSHGGNVVLLALGENPELADSVSRLTTISTPFLSSRVGSHPRIRRALAWGRSVALLFAILSPLAFTFFDYLLRWMGSGGGMIGSQLTPMTLWGPMVALTLAIGFGLTSERRSVRMLSQVGAFAMAAAVWLAPSIPVAEEFRKVMPPSGPVVAMCIAAWHFLCWRMSRQDAECVRDFNRAAILLSLPFLLLIGLILAVAGPSSFWGWGPSVSSVLMLTCLFAGSIVGMLASFLRPPSLSVQPQLIPGAFPVTALRVTGDEATAAITLAARIDRFARVPLQRTWLIGLVLALSPLFLLQLVGLAGLVAYFGPGALLGGGMGLYAALYGFSLTASILFLGALTALAGLALAVGPEAVFALSASDIHCSDVPLDLEPSRLELTVFERSQVTGEGMIHSAYNFPEIRERILQVLTRSSRASA